MKFRLRLGKPICIHSEVTVRLAPKWNDPDVFEGSSLVVREQWRKGGRQYR